MDGGFALAVVGYESAQPLLDDLLGNGVVSEGLSGRGNRQAPHHPADRPEREGRESMVRHKTPDPPQRTRELAGGLSLELRLAASIRGPLPPRLQNRSAP